MNEPEIKSARQWDFDLGTHIVDWDGFENRDLDTLMSREEFTERAMHATRMITATKPPEVSPRAREAAEKEVQQWLCVRPGVITGEFVQRALDAAVAEKTHELNAQHGIDIDDYARVNGQYRTANEVLTKEVRRLTKELADARDERAHWEEQWTASEKQLAQRVAEVEKERTEADRRAGEALRRLEFEQDSSIKRTAWLDRAKSQWGVNRNVSFDEVWSDCLQIKAERDKLRGYYDEIVRELGDDLALKRIRELSARCAKLEKALKYPRYIDTAGLLIKAAEHIESHSHPGYKSYFAPHLRNAALGCTEALNQSR